MFIFISLYHIIEFCRLTGWGGLGLIHLAQNWYLCMYTGILWVLNLLYVNACECNFVFVFLCLRRCWQIDFAFTSMPMESYERVEENDFILAPVPTVGVWKHASYLDAELPIGFALGDSSVVPVVRMYSSDLYAKRIAVTVDVSVLDVSDTVMDRFVQALQAPLEDIAAVRFSEFNVAQNVTVDMG